MVEDSSKTKIVKDGLGTKTRASETIKAGEGSRTKRGRTNADKGRRR